MHIFIAYVLHIYLLRMYCAQLYERVILKYLEKIFLWNSGNRFALHTRERIDRTKHDTSYSERSFSLLFVVPTRNLTDLVIGISSFPDPCNYSKSHGRWC